MLPLFLLDFPENTCYNTLMIIGFTGSQEDLSLIQFDLLVAVLAEFEEITEAHHGDCIGGDLAFHLIIEELRPDVEINVRPPTDKKKRAFCHGDVMHTPRDFLDRNHDIVDSCDILIACPKMKEILRSGTWATVRYARKTDKPIAILWRDGKYTYENQSAAEPRKSQKDENEKAES